MFRRIVAPRIEMRQFEMADADRLFALVELNRGHLRQWLPWVDATLSVDDVLPFLERVQAQYDADQGPNAGIWVDGALAGSVGCHPISWAHRNCSLGYWISAAHSGKGVVTRCVAVLLDHLFEEMDLHRVEIRCGTANARSCAIPQRLGFTQEGVAREAEWVNDHWVDLRIWSILEHDWRAQDSQGYLKS